MTKHRFNGTLALWVMVLLLGSWVSSQAQQKLDRTALLRIHDQMLKTPIRSSKNEKGEIFLQRRMDDYLNVNYGMQGKASEGEPDKGHDHKEAQLLVFLNRPHPSVATMEHYFTTAAKQYQVPVELLKATAQVQSNWAQVSESMYGSWGVMGLVENEFVQQITQASKLLSVSKQSIQEDAKTNIWAAAALLKEYQKGKTSLKIEDWFSSVELLTGLQDPYYQQQLALRIYKVVQEGSISVTLWREIIDIPATPIKIQGIEKVAGPLVPQVSRTQTGGGQHQRNFFPPNANNSAMAGDYGDAVLNLTTCNFNSRNGAPIEYYFVHYIATGTYEGAINWFKNCTAQASTHYIVRNSDGEVTQVVMEANRAWSQGVSFYNDRGIGTEHEVLSTNLAMWYSDPMLTEAGKLANDVCNRRSIPKQRAVAAPGINGHNDVKSTSCPNMTQEVWNLFLGKVQLAAGGGVPAIPTLYALSNPGTGTGISASWRANTESNLAGYRLYYSTSNSLTNWQLAANETTLTASTTSISIPDAQQFLVPPSSEVYHFRLTAVATDAQGNKLESPASDIYSRSSNPSGPKVLIVDGFDRTNGSYTGATHSFATSYFNSLQASRPLNIATAANERIADGSVVLTGNQSVIWFVGDESTTNETFTTAEQTKVIAYLEAGGKLLVSGSEIGWDLSNSGTTADRAFYNNYLKALFVGDGASNYTPASGVSGTAFAGLSVPFGITYAEDFPDNINVNGGSTVLFNYAVSGARGGVGYKGVFGSSSVSGGVVYLSFPLETASATNQAAVMDKVLTYLEVGAPDVPPAANADQASTVKGQSVSINVLSNDLPNGSVLQPSTVTVTRNALNGTTTVNTSSGAISYVPNANFVGVDSFQYTVKDAVGLSSNAATVTITVVNPTPCLTNGPEISASYPKRDMRGVWISTVSNIDWPSSRTASPAAQQAELIALLDTMKQSGINAVFFQIRPESDALYSSSLEPWSYYLTGQQGVAPSPLWDPLQFIIDEAHKRGMELHAWMNPYRAKQSTPSLASNHVAVEHPEWTFVADSKTFLDPGIPAVRNYITSVVADVVSRYAVDGIHFDDYFYPYAGMGTQDATPFANYNPGGLTIDNWRRDNVNKFVAQVYDQIQLINASQKRAVRFGISPFGIWKSGTPAGITGMSSYSDIYCDPIAWLQAGKVDYLAPQLYWTFGGGQDYAALSKWWNDQCASYNRHCYPGLGLYRLIDANWPATEIQNQINENRKSTHLQTLGQIFFTANDWMKNDKSIKTVVRNEQYKFPAFPPALPWLDGVCPEAPVGLQYASNQLTWNAAPAATDGDTATRYVVYKYTSTADVNTLAHDGTKVLAIVTSLSYSIPASLIQDPTNVFVVTALDKNNNESVQTAQVVVNGILPSCTNTLTDLIVDFGSSGYSQTSGWVVSTSNPTWQGTNYYHDNNLNKGTQRVTYSPNVAGVYDVYTWYVSGTNRATNVLYRITHEGGVTDKVINQQLNGSTWVYLGRYTFTSGITNKVELRNDGSNNVVIADAVRFTFAGCKGGCLTPLVTEKIVDDVNATQSAGWTLGANAGFYGSGYKHDGGTGQGTKTVTFTPSLSVAGSYELFTWHVSGTNRGTNALVNINHLNGVNNVLVNQQLNGSRWVSLGVFDFDTTSSNRVVISNSGANGVVIADAFRWVYKGCPTGTSTPARAMPTEQLITDRIENSLQVVPNPIQGKAKLLVSSVKGGLIQWHVYDAQGQLILKQQILAQPGRQQVDIDASRWKPGLYILQATLQDGTSQVIKLLKQ